MVYQPNSIIGQKIGDDLKSLPYIILAACAKYNATTVSKHQNKMGR